MLTSHTFWGPVLSASLDMCVHVMPLQEDLPQSLSAQEALKMQKDREDLKTGEGALKSDPFECARANDLTEPIDWRSLLNAAGLGDLPDEEITIEAEELQARLDQYAPRSPFTICGVPWECLLRWKW